MGWTKEQNQAIQKEGANILVSAAAGSGKTTVLVARIINKVVNEKIDIDKLLVVTFTNAAASEMKQRLLEAIYKEIDKNPNDENLQRQIMLLNRAHICTIHSFCLDVIRNNFYELGISANFRVADSTEIEIMKQETIEDIFEKKYEEQDEKFLNLLDLYTTYKDDQPLKDIVLNTFEFIGCVPFPEKWLSEKIEEYNLKNEDFEKTAWGKLIIEKSKEIISDALLNLEAAKKIVDTDMDLADYEATITHDINDLKSINLENWDIAYDGINSKTWDPWPRKGKLNEDSKELKEKAKALRDEAKAMYEKELKKIMCYTSEETVEDLRKMYPVLKSIEDLVLEFQKEFSRRKKEKNIVDFTDIEHLALKLLVDEEGKQTEIAKKYNFAEIAIDEYQDSNLVQEKILTSVSNGHNVFMVGDVKQSIYRFRQARPDLFLNKYDSYAKSETSKDSEDEVKEKQINKNTKIQLYNNFRSRENVLEITNLVFQNIMSKKLGEINYNKEEYLNYSASFAEPRTNCETELDIIETESSKMQDETEDSEKNQEQQDDEEVVEKSVLEARLAGKKIKELKEKGFEYREMAILLRSPGQVAPVYEKELIEQGIPIFSDTASEYLESIEIDTILSLLKIIDNPLQDIPLVTVLRSPIGGFTDNELVEIRSQDTHSLFFKALEKTETPKVKRFLELLENFKKAERELPLDELIWKIYSDTGYYHYVRLMPNGKLRQANLKKLFEKAKEYEAISFKGLFNFITFIEKVAAKSSNMTAAKIIGENDDVVRIMSIHKSKGLEFPIVIICGTDKKINLMDMNEKIIYDQDMGIGINYIGEGTEYTTLSKEAIRIKMKKESISEEMRVLYVALTRAKEKLIIIGADKKVEESIQKKEQEIEKYHGIDRPQKMNSKLVEKYTRYLDWLELVYKYNNDIKMSVNIINKSELKEDKTQDTIGKTIDVEEYLKNQKIDTEKYKKVDELLNWKYQFEDAIEAPSKTSVTALKQENEAIDNIKYTATKKEIQTTQEDNKNSITGAKLGTLIHLALQEINSKNIDELIENIKVSEEEKNALNSKRYILENYINSDLFKMIEQAKEVHKETPFYMNIPYKKTSEKILVQGVIDLYFISSENELILVDYKTDKNVSEEELKERYTYQLELYRTALEKSLNRKVDKMWIYSTTLNKIVEL